jgi:hypothetical protein
MIFDFVDAPLQVKTLDCFPNFAPRKLFDHLFQLRVFLTDNFFEPNRFHACFLKLSKWPPGFYGLMLPMVAYQ